MFGTNAGLLLCFVLKQQSVPTPQLHLQILHRTGWAHSSSAISTFAKSHKPQVGHTDWPALQIPPAALQPNNILCWIQPVQLQVIFMTLCDDIRKRDSLYGSILCYSSSTNCEVSTTGWNTRQIWPCVELRAVVHETTNWSVVNLLYCAVDVYVCVSVSGRGFYYPVTPKNALVGIDNPEEVVSDEPFILQFISNMSRFRAEHTS